MPFRRVFERRVNEAMQQGEPGRAPTEIVEADDADMKKQHEAKEPEFEEEDQEFSEKKDRPPRFSTLFEGPKAPQVIETYVPPKRKSGVFVPTPLFIVFALILLFESTILFAYTVIGLYNNLPSSLLAVGGPAPAPIDGCKCAQSQGAINISPNFFMPGAQAPEVSFTMTGSIISDALSTARPTISSTSTPNTSSSTLTTSSTNNAQAAASDVLSMLGGLKPSSTTTSNPNIAVSTKVVTATPTRSTVYSTFISTAAPAGPPTVTSVKVVHASSSLDAKRRSLESRLSESVNAASSADSTQESSSTTLQASPSPPPATTEAPDPSTMREPSTVDSSSTSATGMPCFGGSGAVALNCPDGV